MLDRVESFKKVDRSKDCPTAWRVFEKPIRNGQRKIKDLIRSRPTGRKPARQGEGVELELRKKIEKWS